jgi:hypothetical protein
MVTAMASSVDTPHLLDSATANDVSSSPYPHLVRLGALRSDLYQALAAEFPTLSDILNGRTDYGNNEAVRMTVRQVLTERRVSRQWQDFFAYHTSQDYWKQITRLFAHHFRTEFPGLEERVGRAYEDWRVIPRGFAGDAEVRLDCQFVMNTPVTQASSVKTPHVDLCDKIFSSLLYFRSEEDQVSGGDLDLYAWHRKPRFIKHRALNTDIDLVETVQYAANTFVCFVNSAKAVHGVSPRGVTSIPRRYINFIAELPIDAFTPKQISRWQKLWLSKDVKQAANSDKY